jgi:hypothetical protein
MLHVAYESCSQEAERPDNGGREAATIMAYAAILEALKGAIGGTIPEEMKARDAIQADIDKSNRGARSPNHR